MRTQEINTWVSNLSKSLGGVRRPVDPAPLLALHKQQDYTGMVRLIRDGMGISLPMRVGYVNSGGKASAPAWVEQIGSAGLFNPRALVHRQVTIFIRKSFLAEMPFHAVVVAFAHELSHVVLDGMGHALHNQEEAVDLTAMILGYRNFYTKETTVREVAISEAALRAWWEGMLRGDMRSIYAPLVNEKSYNLGYLSLEERQYAASLMQ